MNTSGAIRVKSREHCNVIQEETSCCVRIARSIINTAKKLSLSAGKTRTGRKASCLNHLTKRQLGRQRRRRKNNFKMDIKNIVHERGRACE